METTAALARTAGIALADGPLDGMPAESVAEVVGLAGPRFLGALARERPAVVVVEDLHWAEAPLLDILERLGYRAAGPLLIVATARPEFAATRPSWSATPGMTQIGLEPLTDAQSRALVENLLQEASVELRDRVAAPAEGNPFFAEELVRHLTSDAHSEAATSTIPNSVRALIASRIDALPQAEKRTLQDAAVVGRTFWATALESMAGGAAVQATLRALETKGFVVASPTSLLAGQPEYAFSHALKREVAYRSIPRARRARAHADVAAWIEELTADRRGEFADLIPYHHEAAASPEDAALAWPDDPAERERVRAAAVAALLDAGEAARSRLTLEDALQFADRASALAGTDEERLRYLELRASALHAAVRSDEAFAAYGRPVELAAGLHDAATVARLRAHAALLCARYSGAFSDSSWTVAAGDAVERGLEEIGERTVSFEAGALLLGRSAVAARRPDVSGGEHAAEEDARRALEIAEAIDSPYLLAHAVEALIGYTGRAGFCDAAELGERLAHAAETLASRVNAHEARITAAICLTQAGRYERARELAREATRETPRMSPHRATHAAAAEASCLAPAGRFEELLEVTADVADVVRHEGGRLCQNASVALAGRALALFERGDHARASEALELFEAAPPPGGVVRLRFLAIDLLRPLAGPSRTRRAAARAHRASTTLAGGVYEPRLNLQLTALLGKWNVLAELIPRPGLSPRAHARRRSRGPRTGRRRSSGPLRATARRPSPARPARPSPWSDTASHRGPAASGPAAVHGRRSARRPGRTGRSTARRDGCDNERDGGRRCGRPDGTVTTVNPDGRSCRRRHRGLWRLGQRRPLEDGSDGRIGRRRGRGPWRLRQRRQLRGRSGRTRERVNAARSLDSGSVAALTAINAVNAARSLDFGPVAALTRGTRRLADPR